MAREILFRESVLAFMSNGSIKPDMGFGDSLEKVENKKVIGHYCGGKDVNECRTYFGDNLENICKTCPQ